MERKQIQISGLVQSVGFRPFLYSLATRYRINGRVQNNERGVLLDLEGDAAVIDQFVAEIRTRPPVLARIDSIECRNGLLRAYYDDFRIVESAAHGKRLLPISTDVATCADCLRELFDPGDRRFRYPFINCTNCGPRFTIIEDTPYDRARTTMRDFEMCAECRREYEDPLNRRFHAEPTACARCGPRVSLTSIEDDVLIAGADAAVAETVTLLAGGKIVAIKGIGGFHLACDALNETAVTRLRQQKYREEKPFALMAKSLSMVEQHCEVSNEERELLLSMQRPIVLLKRKGESGIPESVAPRVNSLGFMLPYSPLHHLLLEQFDRPLVMTSANVSDEPICYKDVEARRRLAKLAEYLLGHNRRIHTRMDDSVVRVGASCTRATTKLPRLVVRRSRGYAPAPVETAFNFSRQILACGAELKNTFCLTRDNQAFVSHHIGDLENLETLSAFTEGIEHFKKLFDLNPEVIAYDLHPEYLSTKYALAVDGIETRIAVQHHHAHIASCMADNQIDGDVIGIAMDGLGYGLDDRLWGGEFFVANFAEAERVAHLDYMPLPGGAKAIREPWRMGAQYLQVTFGDDFLELDLPFVHELDVRKWKILNRMTATRTNSPETSSIGRLFDAVSSLVRLRDFTNYEGQAAIELEQIADPLCDRGYEFEISTDGIVQAKNVIRGAVEDLLQGVRNPIVSAKFHNAIAGLILRMAETIRQQYTLNRVVLSGGVFQNLSLVEASCSRLDAAGFVVFTHKKVPANDGGISLGQAAVANARLIHRPQ